MNDTVDSTRVFRMHRLIWELYMEPRTAKKWATLRYCLTVFINTVMTFWFPGHLLVGLLLSGSRYEVFELLAIFIPAGVCSFKTFWIWRKYDKVRKVDELMKQLDRRISEPAEVAYYKDALLPAVNRVLRMFQFLCAGAVTFMCLAAVITGTLGDWKLMYPGYFPFDPYSSTGKFVLAESYQFLGICVTASQDWPNDTYAPMGLAMIAGHVHILRIRVSKIGWNPEKTPTENNAELVECIETHKELLAFNHAFHEVISIYMVVQIVVSAVNMCVVLINAISYSNDVLLVFYYVVVWSATLMETFPSCYYGSTLEAEFDKLSVSILSCNWVDQNKEFKQNFRIFLEQSLRKITSEAGAGMIHINLDSFIKACKGAYSLFTFLMQTQ